MAYYTYIFCLGKGFVEVFAVALSCVGALVSFKGRFYFSVASLGFAQRATPFYCGCALHLYFGFAQRATPFSLLAQRKWGKRKGTLNACFSSFRSDFPGGKKTDFSSKLEKLTLFLPENLSCIRASVKGNPLVLLSKFVIGNKLKARFHD
ncbi:hypothetical protein [Gallibacterium anatis]|uniref:hypothetical protein n=1 Tax=Gallibacterium anatis TaxID=750 RepID=UPI001364DAAB|nr:hypothetical protein [Gallibacterium anatis]